MNEKERYEELFAKSPTDVALLLEFAEWLDANGDPKRAAQLRIDARRQAQEEVVSRRIAQEARRAFDAGKNGMAFVILGVFGTLATLFGVLHFLTRKL